jgi:ribosomal protein L10
MVSEIATATVALSSSAEQISSDIVAVEQVSEETVKALAAITVESDSLSALSVELKDEISRFTHNRQQTPNSITSTLTSHNEIGILTWLKPSVNCAT